MPSRLYQIAVDAHDPAVLARFWAAVLDWQVVDVDEVDGDVAIGRDADTWPQLLFLPVPDAKTVKNRLHLDLNPQDRDAEVDRLLGLGASRVDVGQGDDVSWVVLADPEGNEFCVLQAGQGGL